MDKIDETFLVLIENLKQCDFNDENFINDLIKDNEEDYQTLFNILSTIEWESDKNIDNAYDSSAIALFHIGYLYSLQMIKCEEAENYEAAKKIYDIIFKTYYIIDEYLNPNFDGELAKEEIKEEIKNVINLLKEALQKLQQLN